MSHSAPEAIECHQIYIKGTTHSVSDQRQWLDWAEISQGKEPKFSGVPLNYVYKIVTFKKKIDREFSDKLQLIGWVRYGGNLMQVIKYPLVLLLPSEPGEQQVIR